MKRISFLTAFCLFVPLFADEGLWVDNLRGSDANTGTRTAPFATIERACALVKKSQKITVVNTGKPYSLPYSGFDKARGLRLTRGGTADRPQIVEGNGAVISGFAAIPAAHWSQESGKPNIFSLPFWPMVNSYKNPYFRTEFLAGRNAGLVRGQCCRSELPQSCRAGKNSRRVLVEQERKTCTVCTACR